MGRIARGPLGRAVVSSTGFAQEAVEHAGGFSVDSAFFAEAEFIFGRAVEMDSPASDLAEPFGVAPGRLCVFMGVGYQVGIAPRKLKSGKISRYSSCNALSRYYIGDMTEQFVTKGESYDTELSTL